MLIIPQVDVFIKILHLNQSISQQEKQSNNLTVA